MKAQHRLRRVAGPAAACALAVVCAMAAIPATAEPYESNPDAASRDPDYAAGKQALEKKEWALAVARFSKAAAEDPRNADLQNYLGYSYRNLKQFDRAFQHYKLALDLDPRHRGAHEYIGEAYLLTGDVASAKRHLALLREICLLSCEELEDLDKAIAKYRLMPQGSTPPRTAP